MPLYEFSCEECGLKFEELKTLQEDSEKMPCRKCGGNAVKVMSSFAPVVARQGKHAAQQGQKRQRNAPCRK